MLQGPGHARKKKKKKKKKKKMLHNFSSTQLPLEIDFALSEDLYQSALWILIFLLILLSI
jgi:hypothetical protein